MRSGQYTKQAAGYSAFVPAPLPPDPLAQIDAELARLLSDADRSLGLLDGVAAVVPNPDLFVSMYVRQEEVLSSQLKARRAPSKTCCSLKLMKKDGSFRRTWKR